MSSDLAQNVEFVIFDMDGLLSRFTSSFVRLRADGPSVSPGCESRSAFL
jgi:hypothetical protein